MEKTLLQEAKKAFKAGDLDKVVELLANLPEADKVAAIQALRPIGMKKASKPAKTEASKPAKAEAIRTGYISGIVGFLNGKEGEGRNILLKLGTRPEWLEENNLKAFFNDDGIGHVFHAAAILVPQEAQGRFILVETELKNTTDCATAVYDLKEKRAYKVVGLLSKSKVGADWEAARAERRTSDATSIKSEYKANAEKKVPAVVENILKAERLVNTFTAQVKEA